MKRSGRAPGRPLGHYSIEQHRRASWPIYAATNAIVRFYTARDPAARIARAAGLRVAACGPVIRPAPKAKRGRAARAST